MTTLFLTDENLSPLLVDKFNLLGYNASQEKFLMRKIIFGFVFLLFMGGVGANAQEQNTFTYPKLGFTVTKPSHWQVASAEDYFKNLEKVTLEDAEFLEKAKKYAKVPLVAFMKYPEPYADINPSFMIHFKYRESLPGFAGKGPKEIINVSLLTFKQVLKDFKIIEGPMDVDISGIKSAYVKYQYTLTVSDGRGFPNCSEMWIVPRGNYFYLIVVGRRQDAIAEDLEDIKQIMASIKIEH